MRRLAVAADSDLTLEEQRILSPHSMIGGAYWCLDAALPMHGGGSGVRYSVCLCEWAYRCPTCGERVTVPTCGGNGE